MKDVPTFGEGEWGLNAMALLFMSKADFKKMLQEILIIWTFVFAEAVGLADLQV